jgi:hypothetical protein
MNYLKINIFKHFVSGIMSVVILSSCQSKKLIITKDNFEADTLNQIWTSEKFIPGAFELQSEVVKSGKKAAKLILREGDQIDEEKGTNLERAELREPKKLMAIEHNNYSYSFSLFLPADFPIVPTRLVIAQWKQNCEAGGCNPNNPIIAIRYDSGKLRITLQTGPEKTILYSETGPILNQWLDFKFNIRFSRNNNGQIKTWLNDKIIIDYNGVTAYSNEFGYPKPGNFYFKMGLYRDTMSQPMTIYIDDYMKQQFTNFK